MRLFVAVDLPPDVKAAAGTVIERLRPVAPEAKWVPEENLHVTIAFLGETPLVEEISAAVDSAAASLRPFSSALNGLGTFPSARRARVVWLALDGEPGYGAVAAAVWRELRPLGFEPEGRAFAAHLTIARLRAPAPFTATTEVPSLGFDVDALTLFRSRLARPAPTYEPVRMAPFGGAGL